MKDTMLLIKLRRDYADEFDVEGFVVMTSSQWEEHKKLAKDYFTKKDTLEVYFGTNECLEWSSCKEYIQSFKVSELTQDEINVFKKHFLIKGHSWEYPKGKMNVRPDKITFGIIPMLKNNDEM